LQKIHPTDSAPIEAKFRSTAADGKARSDSGGALRGNAMKAMVLAAGQGTRLHPLTERTPKALVPVAGRPMIDYCLLLLKRYGIRDIIINLHHLGDQIESYLGDGKRWGLQITYSKEPELLDTGGGLLKAKPFLQEGTFIVINTDVLIDLPSANSWHITKRKELLQRWFYDSIRWLISMARWTSTAMEESIDFSRHESTLRFRVP